MKESMAIKVGVVGAAGYAGVELVRLLISHPDFELTAITSNADAGQSLASVYPAFAKRPNAWSVPLCTPT